MRKNVQIVCIILMLVILIGLITMLVKGTDDKETTSPTTSVEKVTPLPTAQGKDDDTTNPENITKPAATNSPTVTSVPTDVTPSAELTVTPSQGADAVASPEVTSPVTSTYTETEQKAVDLLCSVSADELGLTKDITECYIFFDSWTTNVGSKECYGLNVGYKSGERVATFYVAVDQTAIYRMNEDDIFVSIPLN